MVSRLARRSGFAVFTMLELLDWKPDTVIQVGVGHHHEEVDLMHEEWPECEIIGFEAHPGIVKAEKENYPGKLIHMAITDHDGEINFYLKRNHGDGSSIHPIMGKSHSKVQEVPCAKLDTILDDSYLFNRILLWLDCEGAELKALEGGKAFLEGVEVINIEMTSNPPSPEWCDMMTVHRWLVDAGYKRQTAHSNRSYAGQIDAIYVRPELWQAKYCPCPCSFE